jgi:hypothetical protein
MDILPIKWDRLIDKKMQQNKGIELALRSEPL